MNLSDAVVVYLDKEHENQVVTSFDDVNEMPSKSVSKRNNVLC